LVTGDAVNVAARLEQAAQPGEILLTGETQRLVRDAVEVEPMGEVSVKGREAPIEAFRLVAVNRSAAGHERRLDSPMVGRDRPRRLLEDAFADVRDRRICHLFTVLGPAGVGKSRLVNEFLASLGDQARVVRGRCLSYGEGITYWPVTEIVRSVIGEGESPGAADEHGKLVALLHGVPDAERVAQRVGSAVGLTRGDPVPEETNWAIRTFLEALAAERPLVVVLDDLHWAEPALLDLVDHVADWSEGAPILIIALARRELLDVRPAWGGGKRSATTISLEPLDAEQTAQLIDNLLGQASLPATVFDRIREVAEGNPLFVEELIEMLIDEGTLARRNGGWEVRREVAASSMPPTIQALLAARLDGLGGSERAVLERGAVEGTVFHRDAVAALAPEAIRESVGPSLQSLTRREFVAPDRAELIGREAYRFRHQLIRDAAYQAMAKQSRAELHERFASWLEVALADRADEYRPILGYHLEQAARYRRELDAGDPRVAELGAAAARHLGEAGRAALARGDLAAAANLSMRAAELEVDPWAVVAWRLVAGEAMSPGGTAGGSQGAVDFLAATRAAAEAIGDQRAAAIADLLALHPRVALGEDPKHIAKDADKLRAVLGDLGDGDGAARATLELAKLSFWAGQAQPALDLAMTVLDQGIGDPRLRDECRRWIGGFAYWGPMPTDEAVPLVTRLSAEIEDPAGFGGLRLSRNLAGLLAMQGRFDEARARFEAELGTWNQLGDVAHGASLQAHFIGPAERLSGNLERSIEVGREGLEALLRIGSVGFANTAAAELSRAYFEHGDLADAESAAKQAIELAEDEDPAAVPEALGVLARIAAGRGDYDEAERLARRGIEILVPVDHNRKGAAHDDLAEVLLLAGRKAEAISEMETALGYFEAKGYRVEVERVGARLDELRGGTPA
jgi:tetratricopeptide (TPR) repeat protein